MDQNCPFPTKSLTALEAQYEAQKIAFSPYTFQAVRTAWKEGLLACLAKNPEGITVESVAEKVSMSLYGITVILESCLSVGVVACDSQSYTITSVGQMFLHDRMTQVNMNYAHDVNYLGLFCLDEAIRENRPAGLKVFGDWPTIYPALSTLPEPASTSWFDFDHFYSDNAFPKVLKQVFQHQPKKILDVGGNTGKFAIACAQHDDEVQITLVDLPEQLAIAKTKATEAGFSERIDGVALNVLQDDTHLPTSYDAICMSQFLDCFSEGQIVAILRKARSAMAEHARLFILETYWDNQRFETAAFCIVNTSLYFTAMANGNSRMYKLTDMLRLLQRAGLQVENTIENIGMGHTLLEVSRAPDK